MKIHGMDVYLNGIRMRGKRSPPVVEADGFIREVMKDLLVINGVKHKCTDECDGIWTIAIGPDYTEKDTFMECLPWYDFYESF